jgi:hypothetical protein
MQSPAPWPDHIEDYRDQRWRREGAPAGTLGAVMPRHAQKDRRGHDGPRRTGERVTGLSRAAAGLGNRALVAEGAATMIAPGVYQLNREITCLP